MIYKEFTCALKMLNVNSYDDEYRIKGFLLTFVKAPNSSYISLKGKIPYPLAQAINEKGNLKIDMGIRFLHPYEDETVVIFKKYITNIKINSVEALQIVIEIIRAHPYINKWAIGNY